MRECDTYVFQADRGFVEALACVAVARTERIARKGKEAYRTICSEIFCAS